MTTFTLGCAGTPLSVARCRRVKGALEAAGAREIELQLVGQPGTLGGNSGPPVNGAGALPLQRALADAHVDAAVIDMANAPGELEAELTLAAVLPRTSLGDVLVVAGDEPATLDGLPHGSVLGTGSPRVRALALAFRPDFEVQSWEDGVDGRLRRLDEGQADAAVVAGAELRLLGLSARAAHALDETMWLPAPGQGAIGVVTRSADKDTLDMISRLDDSDTRAAVTFERSMAAALDAEASLLVGAIGLPYGGGIRGWAMVASSDGRLMVRADLTGSLTDGEALGVRVARRLYDQGAQEILEEARDAAISANASS